MPLEFGRIQQLPVKVLYTIDTSPQSYMTVLPAKQSVYVHPHAPASSNLLGSCALKALARGLCFASPECVPNKSSLDFSVYNLDPAPRTTSNAPASRAFPNPTTSAPAPASSAWTGKGFLSWALIESGAGATLARGRLVREYEFSPSIFAEGQGLEGLMAAASHHGQDDDGKGWGLEVTLTLRQLNPEGKSEFAGRKAFEDMLAGGKSSATAPLAVVSSPARDRDAGVFAKPALPPPKSPSPINRNTVPPGSPSPVRRRAGPLVSAGPSRQVPSSQPVAGPSRLPAQPSKPPVKADPARSRDSTPPPTQNPAPPPRTPVPPSPSRAALMNLLKSEGKMSPDLAKKLANNEFLVRLLKALPPGANGTPTKLKPPATAPATEAKRPAPTMDHTSPFNSHPPDSCYNCGTTESEQWMMKKLKDGGSGRVCNSCGVYFNKHKRMRPRELWGGVTHSDPPAPQGVRSSPRLNRTRQEPIPESPRKRQRKAVPTPSPRRTTRASARAAETEDATSPTPGEAGATSLDFSSHFPFNDVFAPASTGASATGTPALDPGGDLESMFLQFGEDAPGSEITLESLFGEGETEGILELLKNLESEGDMAGLSTSEPY